MPYNKSSFRVCGNCYAEFHPTLPTNFCIKCRHVHKECKWCGKPFVVPRSHDRVEHCSSKCGAAQRWKNAEEQRAARRPPCTNCGGGITRKVWNYTTPFKHYFCCLKCYREWLPGNAVSGSDHVRWAGGYDGYYGKSWKYQRKLARARDKVCQRCGKTPEENGKALDVHHIKLFRDFGIEREKEANHLDNLITYCTSCHGFLEWEILP